MKKYKALFDVVLLGGMGVFTWLAIAPKSITMPGSVEMLLLAAILVLLAVFMVVVWRENPADEREAHNQTEASRSAYFAGALVLIIALAAQSLRHDIDPVIPVALLVMVTTKIIVQRIKDQ